MNSIETNFTFKEDESANRGRRIKKPKQLQDLGFDEKTHKRKMMKNSKKLKIIQSPKKVNRKTEHSSIIYQKFKEHELYQKFSFFIRIEKQVKSNFYSSHMELASDIRQIFNNYFTASINDPSSYSDTCTLSNYFEDIYRDYENKTFCKESKNILELKKKMNKLRREIRERNVNPTTIKNTKLRIDINDYNLTSEKEKKISKKYKLSLVNNIRSLNSDQIKGIINIIHDNLNHDDKTLEFDINNLPIEKLKELDKYVKKCLKIKSRQEPIINNYQATANNQQTLSAPIKRENINVNININNNFMVSNFQPQMNLLTTNPTEDVLLRKRNSILSDSDSLSSDEESGKKSNLINFYLFRLQFTFFLEFKVNVSNFSKEANFWDFHFN